MIGCKSSSFENGLMSQCEDLLVVGSKLIGDCTKYTDPAVLGNANLIPVESSASEFNLFYTVTSMGVISSHELKTQVFEDILKHRFENTYGKEIESYVQIRQLSEAFESLVKLSRTQFSKDPQISKDGAKLIELCQGRSSIKSDQWTVGSKETCSFSEVKKDFENYCYGLPPRFGEYFQLNSTIPENIKEQFKLVILRELIVSEITNGNWQVILDKEEEILKGIEFDVEFLDMETMVVLIETALKNSFLKGLTIGLALGKSLANSANIRVENAAHLMHLLVFPTVYDSCPWIPTNESSLLDLKSDKRQEYIRNYLQTQEVEEQKPESRKVGRRQPSRKRGAVLFSLSGELDDNAQNPGKKRISAIMSDSKLALPMISLEL
jgi:hypothetical protein